MLKMVSNQVIIE